ncbi:MAG TPA: sulfatase [Polyangia bacterium]|nr:sulfatase [Polyangia bacterium]
MSRSAPLLAVIALAAAAAPAGAQHAVFDFAANRTLAHGQRAGGLVIAAGLPGFAKYVHFSRPVPSWRLRVVEDGKKVALAQTQAVLEVPLTADQARRATLTLRLKSSVKQTVRATIGGKASPAVPLGEGWQTVTVPLAAGALTEGENKITLTFAEWGHFAGQRASAAVEWIQLGGTSTDGNLPQAGDDGLVLAKDTGAAYYLMVPARAQLSLSGDTGGCAIQLRAGTRGKLAVDAEIKPGAPVELTPLFDRVARLELTASGAACTQAKINAALTIDGAAPQAKYEKRPRNVVFWMTDDTRSDKFKLFNPKTRVETPVIDALAKSSTVFRVAYVQGNESRVSHASLWTGLYPAQHHFIAEKAKLDPKFVTLPEAIKPSGLYTAGYIANGFIDAYWGFAEGWDILHNHIHEGGGLKAEDLVKAARGFLGQHASKPFFLYLGTIDAHVSWRAHAPWIDKYDPEPYAGPFAKACLDPQLDKIVGGKLGVSERDKTRIIALYDSDVSYNDQQLGELMRALDASHCADDTMLVFTADHGEELWDHGKIGHGQSLREELVHVPLIIHYPPLFPAGKVVPEGVEIIDLLPTIVDAIGGKVPQDVQGESLVPLAQGVGEGYPRPAIGSQYELAHTMRLGRWKLWVGGSGDVRLFDAIADAAESHELSIEKPYERRFVTDALGVWMAYQSKWKKSRWGVASNHKRELADDLEK